jgi:thiamine transport system ATP-binding protein
MLQLVRSVCESRNITLLMVSHSLEDAQQIAPRSLVVVDGRIYWDGRTASLISGESEAAAILGVKKP